MPASKPAQLRITLAQVHGDVDPQKNLQTAADLVPRAIDRGADLIVFPEVFMALPTAKMNPAVIAEQLDGSFASAMAQLAVDHGIWLVAGLWEQLPGEKRAGNCVVAISPDGVQVAVYRKLHLFDALAIKESDLMVPGNERPPVFDLNGINVGLAICYDLRFPEVFRDLAARQTELIILPSAWYQGPLKEAHWLTLLRARAIENTCFMAGCNLTGSRFTGRSAVFDPFGVQLTDAGETPGLVTAEIDTARIAAVREKLPALNHIRRDLYPA